ncbi:BsaWI family type II restriction enzyme [Methanoregula sp.]|uniref:BsaWI family type II restriction enzyme n=1 Tax=Methanoregula sp. TaxID=2052170 RepID=UPI003BB02BDD
MPTHEAVRSRQSNVTTEGYAFQSHVQTLVNERLRAENQRMLVLNNTEINNDTHLGRMFLLPVRGYNRVWGDVDLVVKNLENNQPIALISCKTSLHGRFSETLFYSMVYKGQIPDLKVVFATPDKGRQGSPVWKSEWGSHTKPTKDRSLAETYLDGVYIDNTYLRQTWAFEGTTNLGGKIRPIENLVNDLIRWSGD